MKITKENRFTTLWKRLEGEEWDAWEKLVDELKISTGSALNLERCRVLYALGYPIGMGQGAEYWHSSYLLEETAQKMKAFMRGHEKIARFMA